MRKENEEKYRKINTDQEIRHENNLIKLNLENEKISKENEKKSFKKYISFFWQRKTKEDELKKRKKEISNKLCCIILFLLKRTKYFYVLFLCTTREKATKKRARCTLRSEQILLFKTVLRNSLRSNSPRTAFGIVFQSSHLLPSLSLSQLTMNYEL